MNDALERIIEIVQGVWRFRWIAIGVAWVVAIVGWTGVLWLPNVYETHAKVYVDTDSVLRPLLKDVAVESDVGNEVQVVTRTLLTKPNLERVIEKTDLSHRVHNDAQMRALVGELARKIRIDQQVNKVGYRQQQQNLYTISYEDRDAIVSAQVVDELLNSFVEYTLGAKRSDAGAAQEFLKQQIAVYEQRLTDAEQRLAEFKKQHIGLMPSEGKDYFSKLQETMDELKQTETELTLAQRRRSELTRQLNELKQSGRLAAEGGQGPVTQIDQAIQAKQAELDALMLRYTDQHPDVVATRQSIESLKKRREALFSSGAGEVAQVLRDDPVYQETKIALNETETKIAELQTREAGLQAETKRLRALVDTIPEVEAQLARLNRDYTVSKEQYQTLVERLESARISEEAQRTSGQAEFRVLESPVVPAAPSGPDRLRLFAMVALMALAAGAGLAFFLDRLAPVIRSRRMAREIAGLPVFGSVRSVVSSIERHRNRREAAWVGVAAGALLVVFALLVVLQDQMVHLIAVVRQV